jgi:hypothetical protein
VRFTGRGSCEEVGSLPFGLTHLAIYNKASGAVFHGLIAARSITHDAILLSKTSEESSSNETVFETPLQIDAPCNAQLQYKHSARDGRLSIAVRALAIITNVKGLAKILPASGLNNSFIVIPTKVDYTQVLNCLAPEQCAAWAPRPRGQPCWHIIEAAGSMGAKSGEWARRDIRASTNEELLECGCSWAQLEAHVQRIAQQVVLTPELYLRSCLIAYVQEAPHA